MASLMAQMVKNVPAMQATWVQCLVQEDPLEKGMATHSGSCLENPMDRGAWQATVHGVTKELDMTEWLTLSLPRRGVGG